MSIVDTEVSTPEVDNRAPIVNDFSIVVATENGSGSQTANSVLIRAIFKMGIPVSGKNLFPSNIQGLPTWYTIRVSKDGYIARREGAEIVVTFNAKTAEEDHRNVPPGGGCIHPETMRFSTTRDDIAYYPLPADELAKTALKQFGVDPKMRDYLANMAYVGAIAELLGVDFAQVRAALERHFGGKTKPIQ